MGTVLNVTSGAIATLYEEAARAAPAEACGLLLGDGGGVARAVVCANVAADPLRHFEIDPAALIAALRAERQGGAAVLGYWHSHPTGHPLPSATDCEHAGGDGRVWAIVGENAIGWFRDTPGGFTALPTRLVAG